MKLRGVLEDSVTLELNRYKSNADVFRHYFILFHPLLINLEALEYVMSNVMRYQLKFNEYVNEYMHENPICIGLLKNNGHQFMLVYIKSRSRYTPETGALSCCHPCSLKWFSPECKEVNHLCTPGCHLRLISSLFEYSYLRNSFNRD